MTSAALCSRRLGSRLFYDFAGKALGDATSWERLADSVAVEVRRQSPTATEIAVPAATTAQATQGGAVVAAAVEDAHCVLICITERYKARGRCGRALALALRAAGRNPVLGALR